MFETKKWRPDSNFGKWPPNSHIWPRAPKGLDRTIYPLRGDALCKIAEAAARLSLKKDGLEQLGRPGLEPGWSCLRQDLNLVRLPISPPAQNFEILNRKGSVASSWIHGAQGGTRTLTPFGTRF